MSRVIHGYIGGDIEAGGIGSGKYCPITVIVKHSVFVQPWKEPKFDHGINV